MTRVGRPPEAVPPRLAAALFEHLAAGRTLREFCAQRGRPAVRTIHDWRRADPEFAAAYQRSRDIGFDALADQCLEIADDTSRDTITDDDGNERTNVEAIQRSRLRVETRLRLLAVWCPRGYGHRTQLHHEGVVSVQVVTGVPTVELTADQSATPPAALPAAIAPLFQFVADVS